VRTLRRRSTIRRRPSDGEFRATKFLASLIPGLVLSFDIALPDIRIAFSQICASEEYWQSFAGLNPANALPVFTKVMKQLKAQERHQERLKAAWAKRALKAVKKPPSKRRKVEP